MASAGSISPEPWKDRDFLIQAYWKRNQTPSEIGRVCGVSNKTIRERLRALNIPTRFSDPPSVEKVVAEGCRLTDELGYVPTSNDFDEHSKLSSRNVYYHFDKWKRFVDRVRYERDEILGTDRNILGIYYDNGKSDVKNEKSSPTDSFEWDDALHMVTLTCDQCGNDISNGELVVTAEHGSVHLGRTGPTAHELTWEPTYCRRYCLWRATNTPPTRYLNRGFNSPRN